MERLDEFLGQFKRGFQKSNRFLCQIFVRPQMIAQILLDNSTVGFQIPGIGEIPIPVALPDALLSTPIVAKWLAQGFICESAHLPDRGFKEVELDMYGITENFPVHSQTGELECTFLMPYNFNIANDQGVPRFFSYWMNQIQNGLNGPESGFDFRFPQHYYSTVTMTLLDEKMRGTITYQFSRVYPKVLHTTELMWSSENEFAKYKVSFNYSYWRVLPWVDTQLNTALTQLASKVI